MAFAASSSGPSGESFNEWWVPDSGDLHFNYAMREIKNEESFCWKLEFSNHGGRFDGVFPAFWTGRVTDRETGRARGFAFVEMANDDEAVKAIADLDGKELGGRNLKVNEARPKGERPPRSNSGGRTGGGRGRGRFSHEDYRESARQPREPRW